MPAGLPSLNINGKRSSSCICNCCAVAKSLFSAARERGRCTCFGKRVADDADDAIVARAHLADGKGVVAAEHRKAFGLVFDDVHALHQIATGFFHAHYVVDIMRKAERRFSEHIAARAPGDVIQHDGLIGHLTDMFKMLVDTGLRGFVVGRAGTQKAVGVEAIGKARDFFRQ